MEIQAFTNNIFASLRYRLVPSMTAKRFRRNKTKMEWNLHEVIGMSSWINVVEFLQILATAFLLINASHVLRAPTGELFLAQWLFRLRTHWWTIVNRHLTLHITPRWFCNRDPSLFYVRVLFHLVRSRQLDDLSIISSQVSRYFPRLTFNRANSTRHSLNRWWKMSCKHYSAKDRFLSSRLLNKIFTPPL